VFGIPWDRAPLMTNGEALKTMAEHKGCDSISGKELETMWRKGPFVKLSPGEQSCLSLPKLPLTAPRSYYCPS